MMAFRVSFGRSRFRVSRQGLLDQKESEKVKKKVGSKRSLHCQGNLRMTGLSRFFGGTLVLLESNSAAMGSIFVKDLVLRFMPVPVKFTVGVTSDCYRWVPGQAARSVLRIPPGCSLWSLQTPPR